MEKLIKKIMLLSLMLSVATAYGHITYTNGNVLVNTNNKFAFYHLTIKDWSGMYWTNKQNNFFQLDVSSHNPRIAGTHNEIVFYNTQTDTFNGIQVSDVYNSMVEEDCGELEILSTGLQSVLQLKPVSYKSYDQQVVSAPSQASIAFAPGHELPRDAGEPRTKYGFIPEEVEKVLPDVIKTDEYGHKLINYDAMIPMLVQSIQELQATVEAQAIQIQQLSGGQQPKPNSSANRIVGCTPNPTSGMATIEINLVDNAKDATIIISSTRGTREKTMAVSYPNNSVDIDMSSMNSGIYIVSLVVDGLVVDSQRLIKE